MNRTPIQRPVVVIPTFNERDNLPVVVGRLRQSTPCARVLVVDDGSPDGTGAVADELARQDPAVEVLHRPVKAGLGPAYLAGFARALAGGADAVVEMDADGSHAPEELPSLLDALGTADLVMGSRWVPGGSVVDWPRHREVLSRAGNSYARMMLGLPLADATGGFRAYRREALLAVDLDGVASTGYCFQIDLARRVLDAGFTVVELPIRFVERSSGVSKMDRTIVAEALWRVTTWGVARRLGARPSTDPKAID